MQVNGVGNEHNSRHHNVTNCLHEHSVGKKDSGAFRSISLDSVTLSNQSVTPQPEGQLSLSAWLDKTLNSGKDLLQRIWGSDQTAVTNGTAGQSPDAQVLAALADDGVSAGVGRDAGGQTNYGAQNHTAYQTPHAPHIAAATSAVQSNTNQILHQNPYFVTIEERKPDTLWQKMKVKMKDVVGQLSGRFSNLWAKGSFHTKQEQTREDMRKRSKYRQDKLELDCVLTDDSYLQDSYNKKGEYSKLAGDMRGNMSTRK